MQIILNGHSVELQYECTDRQRELLRLKKKVGKGDRRDGNPAFRLEAEQQINSRHLAGNVNDP